MMKIFTFLAATALTAIAISPPAAAQEQYLAATVGTVSGSGSVCASQPGGGCLTGAPDARYEFSGKAAYLSWGQVGGGSLSDRDEVEFSLITVDIDDRAAFDVDGDIKKAAFFAATYWDFENSIGANPFVGVGAGVSYIHGLEGRVTAEDGRSSRFDKVGIHPVLLLNTGVGIEVDKDLDIVTSLRLQYTIDSDYAEENDSSFVIFNIGPRWRI